MTAESLNRAAHSVWQGMVAASILLVIEAAVIYRIGRIDERQTRDAVACTPNVDSVRVFRPRWPKSTDTVRAGYITTNGPIPDSVRVK